MKIRVIGDLQLGSLSLTDTQYNIDIFSKSISENYSDITIFLGSIFRHYNVATRTIGTHQCLGLFNKILTVVSNYTKDHIYILPGNYDIQSSDLAFLPLTSNNITVINFPIKIERNETLLSFWPWTYSQYNIEDIIDSNSIFFGHCILKELPTEHKYRADRYNTFSAQQLQAFNSSFIGHQPYRYIYDTIYMVGQPWHTEQLKNKSILKEATTGYVIFNTENPHPLFVDINTIKYVVCNTEEEYQQQKETNNKIILKFQPEEEIPENVIVDVQKEIEQKEIFAIHPSDVETVEDCWQIWCSRNEIDKDIKNVGFDILSKMPDLKLCTSISSIDKITAIELENIGNIDYKLIEFNESTIIKGMYGSGKTMILESILLALYGVSPTRGSIQNLISANKDNGTVCIEIISGKDIYIIKRYVNTKSKTHNLYLTVNGKQLKEKKHAIEKIIQDKFGSFELACSTWFMCQRQIYGSLVNATAATCEKIMQSVLGQEVFDKIYKSILASLNSILKEKTRLNATIIRINADISNLPKAEDIIQQIKLFDKTNTENIIKNRQLKEELENLKRIEFGINKLQTKFDSIRESIKDDSIFLETILDQSKIENASDKLATLTEQYKATEEELRLKKLQLDTEFKKRKDVCIDCMFISSYETSVKNITDKLINLSNTIDILLNQISSFTIAKDLMTLVEENTGMLIKLCKYINIHLDLKNISGRVIEDILNKSYNKVRKDIESIDIVEDKIPESNPRDTFAILKSKEKTLCELKEDLESLLFEEEVYNELKSCFSPNGIPYDISSYVIPEINNRIIEISKTLNLSYTFQMFQTKGRGDKNEFAFIANVRDIEQNINSCSVGERLLADICIRIILSAIINNSRVFVADEVYEGLPDITRDTLLETLSATGIVQQIIFSTHIDVSTDADIINL